MKKLLAVFIVLLAACAPPHKPAPPFVPIRGETSLHVVVRCHGIPVDGATVEVVRPEGVKTAVTADGVADFVVPGPLSRDTLHVFPPDIWGGNPCLSFDGAIDVGGEPRSYDIDLAPAPAPAPMLPGRLTVDGRGLRAGDTPFVWRGVTAFALLDRFARGDDAQSWLHDVAELGFNNVRVATNLCWGEACSTVNLTPADGRASLRAFLSAAEAEGLYVHVIGLTNTATWNGDVPYTEHARLVAETCANALNCFFEFANEPFHPTQDARLHDPGVAQRLAEDATRGLALVWTVGAAEDDEALVPTGAVVDRHLNRDRPTWDMIRRVRELESVSASTGRPALSGEPIGAAENAEPGRRYADPDVAYAYGVECRIFNVLCTFHFEDGLLARTLGPTQRACAQAFIDGTRVAADDVRFQFFNAHTVARGSLWSDGPVLNFDDTSATRVYAGVSGATGIVISLGSNTPRFDWGNGWRPVEVLKETAGLKVWRIER